MSQSTEEDRNMFNDLPQEVTCEILGYLDLQDIARASTLSKEFNKLCTSLPDLCVDSKNIGDDPNKRVEFFEFLNRHTSKVSEEKSLRCVHLWWKFLEKNRSYEESELLWEWIRKAAASNDIREIDITLWENPVNNFPSVFDLCHTYLEKFKLKGVEEYITFTPINTNSTLNLRSLELCNVVIMPDLFVKWLPESCKNLETLFLQHVWVKTLTIACPVSLRGLSIIGTYDSIDVEAESLSHLTCLHFGTQKIRIFAPNLSSLQLEGSVAQTYYLDHDFKFLKCAGLYSNRLDYTEEGLTRLCPIIRKLIQSVRKAETLYVGEIILQVVKDWNLKLDAVQNLYVRTIKEKQPKKAFYLRRFPGLKYLCIGSYVDVNSSTLPMMTTDFTRREKVDSGTRVSVTINSGRRMRELSTQSYWESTNFEHLECLDQIEILEIDLDKEDDMKLRFVRYLLSNAPALVKMIVHYSTQEFPRLSDLVALLRKSSTVLDGINS